MWSFLAAPPAELERLAAAVVRGAADKGVTLKACPRENHRSNVISKVLTCPNSERHSKHEETQAAPRFVEALPFDGPVDVEAKLQALEDQHCASADPAKQLKSAGLLGRRERCERVRQVCRGLVHM